MAFIAMVFASIAFVVIAIGLGILLLGIILNIVCSVRKRKDKSVPAVLKGFSVVLTVWGIIQGIGPIAFIGIMSLKQKATYRAEISDLPKDSIVYLQDDYDFSNGIDFKGVHYVGDNELHPQVSHENFKTVKVGAVVYGNGKHYIIEKVVNDQDAEIYTLGLIYDPFVPQSDMSEINDYYNNKAPLYCDGFIDLASADKKVVKDIDAIRVRAIRDDISMTGSNYSNDSYTDKDRFYLFFYSYDDMYCLDFTCIETDKGLVVQYLGDEKIVSDKDADYLRSLAYK